MQIDWEEVSPDMEGDAAWYQNIQEAYQEEAQTAYTVVSAEDVPRLAALCAANPQEDLEHITAFILRTAASDGFLFHHAGCDPSA